MAANLPIRVTATGNVGGANGGSLCSVTLTAGGDAASLVIKEGGASGTQIWAPIKAPASDTRHVLFSGSIPYSGQLHATFTGTGPEAGFEIGV